MLSVCGLTAGAVVLGGVTRLTESGLSMVHWHPIKGIVPPLTQAEWETEFAAYAKTPEFKWMNHSMSLEEFKRIWYMEYAHRMWGRLIGLVYAVPAAVFFTRGWIRPAQRPIVLGLGALIGVQGVIGYLMVKSGLDHDPQGAHVPRVSQYRLALHLSTAFTLYLGCLWTGLSHLAKPACTLATDQLVPLRRFGRGAFALTFLTAASGAFVAGLDAGLVYNEFPYMGEGLIPPDLLQFSPAWRNFFENPITTQFDHRLLGTSTGATIAALWAYSRKVPLHPRAMLAVNCMVGMVGVQISLGIATLLWFVPTELAAAHQSGSLTLLTLATWFLHELRKVR